MPSPKMLSSLNITAVILAVTVSAQNMMAPNGGSILSADDVLSKPYSSLASIPGLTMSALRGGGSDNSTLGAGVQLQSDGTLNFTAWDSATSAACVSHLRVLPRSSNPSGSCVCYNLPMLDTTTGMFEADLRLYHVSDPRDSFLGVSPGDIQVGVVYKGASVSPMKPASGSGSSTPVNVTKRAAGDDSESDGPTQLQSYMLVGQIDEDQMKKNLSMAQLEALLMPTLTLTAKTPTGGRVSTNVSLNEAAFLTGVFSNDIVMSNFALAQMAVDMQVAALHNGTVAFILPGTQLMVFPIGLIITSVWLFIGVMAYGFGTYERIKYASMYRRRVILAGK